LQRPEDRISLVTYPENGKGLDVTGGRDVRSSAQIDKGTASVDSTLGAIRDSLLNEILLVLAVLEHLKELILGHLQTLERLLLLDNAVGELLESLLVLFSNNLPTYSLACRYGDPLGICYALSHVGHIVIKTRGVLGGGTVAEIASKASLSGLAENMGRRVPENLLSFGVVEVEELELAALLKRSGQIPQLAINSGDDGTLKKRLGDALGDSAGGGLP
jgi:hypothetical protein